MGALKPAGPSLPMIAVLGVGTFLLFLGWSHMTVHSLWEIPLGLALMAASIGKMVAR